MQRAGGSASACGRIRVGDKLVTVNGQSVIGLTPHEISHIISGPENSQVGRIPGKFFARSTAASGCNQLLLPKLACVHICFLWRADFAPHLFRATEETIFNQVRLGFRRIIPSFFADHEENFEVHLSHSACTFEKSTLIKQMEENGSKSTFVVPCVICANALIKAV